MMTDFDRRRPANNTEPRRFLARRPPENRCAPPRLPATRCDLQFLGRLQGPWLGVMNIQPMSQLENLTHPKVAPYARLLISAWMPDV